MQRMIKQTDFIGSLAKGLRVMEVFDETQTSLTVAQAAKAAGLDRAAARRVLLTLTELGYASYDGKYFTPTPKVLRLAQGSLNTMPLPRIVQPVIDGLSNEIGESVSVSILDGQEIVYIARAAQMRVMTIGLMPGSRLPAHCTSMGRVLLAGLDPAARSEALARADLTPRTAFSISQITPLLAEIEKVAAQGYCLVDQEIELGLRAISVPLVSASGQIQAALNIGVSAAKYEAAYLVSEFLPRLLWAQAQLRPILPASG